MGEDDAGTPSGAGPGGGVGSVAEEAARLLDALMAQDWAAPSAPGQAPDDAGAAEAASPPCPTCGHVQGDGAHHRLDLASSTDPVCRLCPVCQLVRVARTVRPETMERLADLASAVAETLRDVASVGRAERPASSARRTVQDIPLDDLTDDPTDDPGDTQGEP